MAWKILNYPASGKERIFNCFAMTVNTARRLAKQWPPDRPPLVMFLGNKPDVITEIKKADFYVIRNGGFDPTCDPRWHTNQNK